MYFIPIEDYSESYNSELHMELNKQEIEASASETSISDAMKEHIDCSASYLKCMR